VSIFDILPEGYNPDFDIDLAFGKEGERHAYEAIRMLGSGKVEVKRERYNNGSMFIEVAQRPNGYTEFKPSGINVTKADYWAYIKPGGVIIFLPTQTIKDYLATLDYEPFIAKPFSSNPSKGYLVEIAAILAAQKR
jgi:hypothetical protein